MSPIGSPVALDAAVQRRHNKAYAREAERLEPFEQIARLVIQYRMEQELTQEQLAERAGTTGSVISRIEGGQHATKPGTLAKLAHAMGMNFVVGFERDTASGVQRDLVTF